MPKTRSTRQDIEDVAGETYLRVCIAEQRENIQQPKAFRFRVEKISRSRG